MVLYRGEDSLRQILPCLSVSRLTVETAPRPGDLWCWVEVVSGKKYKLDFSEGGPNSTVRTGRDGTSGRVK